MNLDANYALTIMPLLLLALVLVLPCPYSDPEPTTPVSPRLWKEGPKTQVEEDTPKPKPWDSTLHLRSESRKSAESMDLGRKQWWAQESEMSDIDTNFRLCLPAHRANA